MSKQPPQELLLRATAGVATRPTPESLTWLRDLRERFLGDPVGTDVSLVRDVIARSWQRSITCKVDPLGARPEWREAQLDGPFIRLAMPVIERLAAVVTGTGACVLLCDAAGTVAVVRGEKGIARWADARFATVGAHAPEELAGTNSDGTALEEGTSVQVWGPEHFSESLQGTFCSSVPIQDPLRRKIAAVVSLMVPQRVAVDMDPGALVLLVEAAAAEISRLCAARLARREEALLLAYLQESRTRGAEAVLAMDDRTTIASNRAQQILTPNDYAVLSGYAREAETSGNLERIVALEGDRSISVTARSVVDGGEVIGAVVRLRDRAEFAAPVTALARPPQRAFPEMVGDSAVVSEVRKLAAAALPHEVPACVTGERGTGRGHLARLMAGAVSTSYQVIECHPERRRDDQSVVDEWRFAIASESPVVALHVDRLDDEARRLIRDLVRSVNRPTRLFLTAHHLPLDLVSSLALVGPREIKMPPLRSRRDDIPALVAHFLAADPALAGLKVSGKLLGALARADWPGNVAGLRDVILSASEPGQAGILCISDLGEMQRGALARGRLTRLEAGELEQIRHALAEARGNRVRAAQILEIGRSTLYRKIDSYSRRGFDLGG